MHNKFALVDQWLLINGSFNWTRQAIAGNNENVFITDNAQIVDSYQKEFERLWKDFGPQK
jgi:cardiolipin hydrolase